MTDYKELLKKANDVLAAANAKKAAQNNEDRKAMMAMFGQDFLESIKPAIKAMQLTKDDLVSALKNVKISAPIEQPDVVVNVPKIEVPEANVTVEMPEIRVPTPVVNYTPPAINIPKVEWPKENMPIEGWVRLQGVSLENPLPVQLRDASGRPLNLFENLTTLISGGQGGGFRHVIVDKMPAVTVDTSGLLTDAELRASAVPVSQVSGASWSVSASLDSTSALFNADNRLRVSVETGGSGLTDAELRATAVPVSQVSGATWSTEVKNTVTVDGSGVIQPVSATNLDIRDLANATDSVSVYQVSGANWSTEVTNTVTVQATNLDVRDLSSASDSVAATQSGSWTVSLSGSLASTVATGPTVADVADDGSAPVQVGGIARTANPTPVAGGDVVKTSHDDLGRTLTRPIQVRDLTLTAYAQLTNGTETTLRAAVAGAYLDLVYIMGANNSDAAVSVDIRPVTAGNVVMTLQIPASGTAGIACPIPLPQSDTGNNWTADMGDITGTTVSLTALFSQEV